ncbi:MAG: rod shape-determining protein MreC [Deltaproteobacteria bacterium]|nr:MAG: rod shape-determining protein MreC [Deltaproteobacteria bacterium]
MFSKKTAVILALFFFLAANIFLLIFAGRSRTSSSFLPYRVALSIVAPFQEVATRWIRFNRDIWHHYFYLVSATEENNQLKKKIAENEAKLNKFEELTLANERLRRLLDFKHALTRPIVAAEVIGKDPSRWFKTVVIDKGEADGIKKGYPVVIPQGIAGQIIEVSKRHAKVLLLVDRNSAVDALVQRSRARGIIKGGGGEYCTLDYLLRKRDVKVDDIIVSSGLDGVYPKGLSIGRVTHVNRPPAGVFQHVTVSPFVDFEKLEEVVVILPSVRLGAGMQR